MSPSRLSPPVVSESTSQSSQASPVQASQASGGQYGSTPTPSIVHLKRSRRALPGAGSERPTRSWLPAAGGVSKAENERAFWTSTVRSM